jgi:hypothetical protein
MVDMMKHTRMKAAMKALSVALCLLVMSVWSSCGGAADDTSKTEEETAAEAAGTTAAGDSQGSASPYGDVAIEPGSWAIYWYLCGSNLESEYSAGTDDLREMMKATLPGNVKIVVETGGSTAWQNEAIPSDALARYVYSGSELKEISREPDGNMSDPDTLADFLRWANESYPAEKQMVILWDHGGGSLGGVINDERSEGDTISLPELRSVLESAPASSGRYELIGFDACLMATVDTLDVVDDYARFMVAAEESEPGCGWEYAGFLNALAQDTSMDGGALGKAICDSFYAGCEAAGFADTVTLSVLDAGRSSALVDAFRDLGDEALLGGVRNKEAYLSGFAQAALDSENYGGNNDVSGYFDMMDIGDFVEKAGDALLPATGAPLADALGSCVLYQVKGPLRSDAHGLSCFYSYDGSPDTFGIYTEVADTPGYEYYCEYALNGDLSQDGRAYADALLAAAPAQSGADDVEALPPTSDLGLDGAPVKADGSGHYALDVGVEKAKSIADVYLHVMYYSEYGGEIDYIDDLGESRAVDLSRRAEGAYADTFDGNWAVSRNAGTEAVSSPVHLRIIDRKPGAYTLYATPVLLLDGLEDYEMQLSYDEAARKYDILGIKKSDSEARRAGLAEKEIRKLQEGDWVIPVTRMARRGADGDFSALDWAKPSKEDLEYGGAFMLSGQAEFLDIAWLDGYYHVQFVMVDYAGKRYESASGWYRSEGGKPAPVVAPEGVPEV